MARYPQLATVLRRVIENQHLRQKVRLQALRQLPRPSLALLTRLLNDPKTPSRIVALAAEKYEQEILRKELRQRARQRKTETTADDRRG